MRYWQAVTIVIAAVIAIIIAGALLTDAALRRHRCPPGQTAYIVIARPLVIGCR